MRLFIFMLSAFAQQTATQNPYAEAANILRSGDQAPVTTPNRHKSKSSRKAEQPPASSDFTGIVARREIPLTSTARLGLALADQIEAAATPPTTSPDGRILFAYGHSFPTVVCATFEICEIDLEPGETVSKDAIDIGDNRFEVVARQAGTGAGQFPYLIVKPTQAGLDTSLAIGTSVRPYYLRLISTDHQLTPRVAFTYPDDAARKAKEVEQSHNAEAAQEKAEAERLAKLSAPKPLRTWNYSFKLHGKDAGYLKPLSVADDGIHTRITLSDEARHRGLPVVVISDARGAIPANVHWNDNTLVVDAIFEHACLLEGVGKKQQRACLTNEGLK
jgi:P-type conjugative transfer protein TrbG